MKKHILFPITFISENRAVYEIMCKNIVQAGRSQMKIWRMRVAYWIPKATNTHSRCVIVLTVILLQQWLHESALKLRYTNIACLVFQKRLLSIDLFKGALSITGCAPIGQTGRMRKRASWNGTVKGRALPSSIATFGTRE